MTIDDVMSIRHYPAPLRKDILSHAGIRDMRTITRSAATGLVRVLQGNDRRRRRSLTCLLGSPVIAGFGNHDEMTREDCLSLLRRGEAGEAGEAALRRSPGLLNSLLATGTLPDALIDLALADVYGHDMPLSTVAVALLVGSAERLGPQAANAVRSAWRELRDLHPDLPEIPVTLPELHDAAVRTIAGRQQYVPAGEPDATHGDEAGDQESGSEQEPDRLSVEALRDRLDTLRDTFVTAASAAGRIQRALADAARPLDEDVDAVVRGVRDFDGLRGELESMGDSPITEPTADGLQRTLDQLAATDARDRLILPLAQVTGPAPLEEILREVREAAVIKSPILEPLAELIRLAGDPDAVLEVYDLQERFRQEAPAHWMPVATAAVQGRLTAPAEIPESVVTVAASHQNPELRADEQPDPETAADENGGNQGDEDGDGGDTVPEKEPPVPSPSSGAQDAAGAVDHDELADLDAFITSRLVRQSAPTPPAQTEAKAGKAAPPSEGVNLPAARHGTPDQPAPAPVDASPADTEPMEITDRVAAAEASALRAGRFGLAAWLHEAAGRPEAEVNARRCAAIAAEMSQFAGPLSAAFTGSAAGLTMRALGNDTAGHLLAWAAALRAGLVHPTAEVYQLFDELAPVFSRYPGLTAYGEAFSKVAEAGAYLVPGLSGRLYDASQAEEHRACASAAADKLLEEGPSQKIKFALASEVWKSLLQNRAAGLGKLLSLTAHDDAARVREVSQELDDLRTGDAIGRMIDMTAKSRPAGRGNTRIHSGARAKLIEKINNAMQLAADWTAAVHEMESLRTDDSGVSRVVRHLTDLREAVNQYRDQVEEELSLLAGSPDLLVAGAASGAAALIHDTQRLLDGEPPAQSEPLPTHVLNGDLLLLSTIRIAPDTLVPPVTPSVDSLLTLCSVPDRDWRAAFEARAALRDHEGTRALLAVLTHRNPSLAGELRIRRDKLVESARHDRDDRIEDLHDRIAEWRRDGVLPEVAATRYSTALQALGDDTRDDFGVIADALSELERDAANIRGSEIAAARDLLTRLSEDNADVAAARKLIRGYIEAGDLTTARESIAQVTEGKRLPETSDTVDHLERFFPGFPQAFEDVSAQLKGRQRGAEWLQKLHDALSTGREIADPDLNGLLLRTGLSVTGILRGRRGVAENGLRRWQILARGPKTAGNLKSAVAEVLQMIGLEGEQESPREEQNRLWITLTQVRRIGDSPLPGFGSRMSPSGDRLRLLLVWKPPGPQQVIEWLKDQPEDQTALVFYFGVLSAEQRRQLAALSRRRPAPVAALLDDAMIGYLACLPDANWATAVSLLAPFTAANPYAPTGEVPEEMFYGRQDQLREVTGRTGSSFVFGGRQLGKSALLREAEREVRKRDPHRKVISEIIQDIGKLAPVTALWPMLAEKLANAGVLPLIAASFSDPKEICRRVREWIDEDDTRQLLILLDEADEFLNKDARDASFANVMALRNLMNETNRRVKVVFAGLHQTARFQSLPNQPLTHLGTPIAVGPLEPQDAYNLLTKPLAALGFRFPTRLAARVIAEANNAPALIQLFAEALLTRLRRISTPNAAPPYEITREDVDAVWRDNKLARGFRDRFEWTLNLDKRYKVIAYTVAFHALNEGIDVTLTANELHSECQEWWPQGFTDSSSDGFRGLLEECVNLGVLAADGERYRLRTPHILNLLGGAEEVEAVLDQAESFERPDSFDAQSYREAYKGHGERSPLTGSQVTRLLTPRNVLHLIAGSPATQINRVSTALEDAAARHRQAQVLRVGAGGLTWEGAVSRAEQNSDHSILIVDLTDQPPRKAITVARTAAKAITMPTNGTLAVALIAPPEHASEWLTAGRGPDPAYGRASELIGTAELIELQRFNRPSVRQWMHEAGLGFQDETSQDALLRVTGGWPLLISKVISALTGSADRDHALDACRSYLERAPEEFVRSTGVLSGRALGAAWHTLVEADAAETPDTLAELLAWTGQDDETHPLSETGLQEEGYLSTAGLIEVLRILGAVVDQGDGRIRLEPVLLQTTRRMGFAG
ncbi:hypothetical protein IMZ11_25780 [Microtetraspora sp. AC03309]|uniref:nSTAND1 domain-containing NTPase n=1 Tax=Microtetraspora sp. AC03309 TaxID=2779376 RepID=UPI001E547496|nr:hypothetical protein [Microtetraspora sp. AC03309]MCC5579040.1 hypothetical protein [Microtetraspora sp. AC03309]